MRTALPAALWIVAAAMPAQASEESGSNQLFYLAINFGLLLALLLWKARKSAFGAVAQLAPDYYLHDAVVPRTRLVETMKAVYAIGDRYDLTKLNVFHAGDGNLHPLIAFDSSDPEMFDLVRKAGDEIVAACLDVGGALSGEHGIGLEKRDLMRMNFTEVDLDAQARLKEVFDPVGVFNPAKILPEGSRCFDFGGVRRELPDGVWV